MLEGLKGTYLVTAFIAHWVLPLQCRAHIIGQMGYHRDATRMSSGRLPPEQGADRVNAISLAGLAPEWRFGKAPYNAEHPVPVVSPWSSCFAMFQLLLRPNATREVRLNAIGQTYDGTRMQVLANE